MFFYFLLVFSPITLQSFDAKMVQLSVQCTDVENRLALLEAKKVVTVAEFTGIRNDIVKLTDAVLEIDISEIIQNGLTEKQLSILNMLLDRSKSLNERRSKLYIRVIGQLIDPRVLQLSVRCDTLSQTVADLDSKQLLFQKDIQPIFGEIEKILKQMASLEVEFLGDDVQGNFLFQIGKKLDAVVSRLEKMSGKFKKTRKLQKLAHFLFPVLPMV